MALLFLWICIGSFVARAHKENILTGNEAKRYHKCDEPQCYYTCLATKCTNEEVLMNQVTVLTKDNRRDYISSNITFSCMEDYSCIGHIILYGKSYNHPGNVATLYCDYAYHKSCQGSEFRFVNVKHQYLIGDVTKSDILFKNADSVFIVIQDEIEHKTEQFFMNEIYTKSVKDLEIWADSDYSATGSVFDLSGVTRRIRVNCKGYGACAGSLFIFSRCIDVNYKSAIIYCHRGACNDISVWLLQEEPCDLYTGLALNKEIVRVVPVHKTGSGIWPTQKIFVVSDSVDSITRSIADVHWFIGGDRLNFPVNDKAKLVSVQQFGKKVLNKAKNVAFKVYSYKTKEEWVQGVANEVQSVTEALKAKQNIQLNNAWMRTKEGAEAYGCSMMQTMTTRVQWGSMTQGITGIWLWLGKDNPFWGTLYAVSGPLVPMFMVLGGMKLMHGALNKKHENDLKFPNSKLPQALRTFNEAQDTQAVRNNEEEGASQSDAAGAQESVYNAFGDEFMPYHGFILGDNEEYEALHEDSHVNDVMVSQYVMIGFVFVICWCISVLIAIAGGNCCGWLISGRKERKYVTANDSDGTTAEFEI